MSPYLSATLAYCCIEFAQLLVIAYFATQQEWASTVIVFVALLINLNLHNTTVKRNE